MQHPLDQIPCICLNFTGQGLITWVNLSFCTATAYAAEEVLGRSLNEMVTLGTRIFFQTHFFPLIQLHGHAEEIFITLRSKDGKELPLVISTLRNNNGEFSMAGLLIHNRNRYEQEIIAAKKYAEQALAENKELVAAKAQLLVHTAALDNRLVLLQQQNQNLQQLSYSLTHTMQEPLRKLALFSSMLLEEEGHHPVVQKIYGLAQQHRELIAQLQQYLNIGLDKEVLEPVDLFALLKEIAIAYTAQGHQVLLPSRPMPLINGNTVLLKNLFQQLLDNAVRFCQPGKRVEVFIDAVSLQANAIKALNETYQYKTFLRVSVADAGIGFAPEHAEKIFSLFTKFQNGTPGHGMGLAICKKIIEWHKGSIKAEAPTGGGAVFHCFFPLGNEG